MAKIIRREIRKRGFFGQIVKWVFIIFNLLMVFAMFKGCSSMLVGPGGVPADARAVAVGGTAFIFIIMIFWALGTIILGALTLLTRGPTVTVEETIS